MKGLLIVQELVKALLTGFYWLFPIYMWQVSQNGRYLWLFIVSVLLTFITFSHHEILMETMCGEKKPEKEYRPKVEDLYPKRDEEQRR